MRPLLGWAVTFLFVMITFLIFRADNVISILNLLKSSIGLGQPVKFWAASLSSLQVIVLAAAFIITLGFPEPYEVSKQHFWKKYYFAIPLAVLLVMTIVYLGGSFEQKFIYFKF